MNLKQFFSNLTVKANSKEISLVLGELGAYVKPVTLIQLMSSLKGDLTPNEMSEGLKVLLNNGTVGYAGFSPDGEAQLTMDKSLITTYVTPEELLAQKA